MIDWIHPPSGIATKELVQLILLMEKNRMSDYPDQTNPSDPRYYGEGGAPIESMLAKQAGIGLGNLRTPTARAVLQARKDELTKQIKAVDDAIQALDENPGVEKVLNILRKVGI